MNTLVDLLIFACIGTGIFLLVASPIILFSELWRSRDRGKKP